MGPCFRAKIALRHPRGFPLDRLSARAMVKSAAWLHARPPFAGRGV
jgi:hypothetical protein